MNSSLSFSGRSKKNWHLEPGSKCQNKVLAMSIYNLRMLFSSKSSVEYQVFGT